MGSLGGPAARLMGFAMVAQLARRCQVPIISGGGIENWKHAVQFMMWGATLITVCTAIMWHGWGIVGRTIRKMQAFIEAEGYSGYEELTGRSLHNLRAAEDLQPLAGAPLVDRSLCTGCGACLRACPHGAVTGEKKLPHTIDPELCTKCGICRDACTFEAVTVR